MAVAALAIGPLLYRSMLPAAAGAPPASCSFVAATGGLFVLLVGATIWFVRRRRRPRDGDLDRRLWEAALGEDEEARRRGGTLRPPPA